MTITFIVSKRSTHSWAIYACKAGQRRKRVAVFGDPLAAELTARAWNKDEHARNKRKPTCGNNNGAAWRRV